MGHSYRIDLTSLLQEKAELEGREKEIPLTEVSVETGLSYLTVLKLRQDGSSWSRSTLEAICNYFQKEPGEILVRVEET